MRKKHVRKCTSSFLHSEMIALSLPRTSKTSEMVGPFWKYRFYFLSKQRFCCKKHVKKPSFSNKPSFCVCVHLLCQACDIDLLSLQTQPLTMKWSENRRSRLTSNQPMPADNNKRAGSGLRVCAESSCWLLELENQCRFDFWIFEWENAVVYCYSTLIVSKLGDDNVDIQCAICSNFVNFYAPAMVKTWGPEHVPVLIPYLPRTKPVFSCAFEFWKKNGFQKPVIYP